MLILTNLDSELGKADIKFDNTDFWLCLTIKMKLKYEILIHFFWSQKFDINSQNVSFLSIIDRRMSKVAKMSFKT